MLTIQIGSCDGFPVIFSPRKAANSHIGLFGRTGEGKTVMAQKIMLQLAEQGATVIAFNVHGTLDADQILPAFEDRFIKLRQDFIAYDSPIPLNIFSPLTFCDGTQETEDDTIGAVADIFSRSCKLGPVQKSILRTAVDAAMRHCRETHEQMSTVLLGKYLQKCGTKEASSLFEKLRGLLLRDFFSEGTALFTPGRINVVGLEKLHVDLQELVQEVILAVIWRLANAGHFKNAPLWLFVDEVQNSNSGKEDSLPRLVSEGRKMGINLIMSTQIILNGSPSSLQQRLPQCGIMLFCRPSANRVTATAKMIAPGDIETWSLRLRDLKVGQFVAVGNFSLGGAVIDHPLVVDAREKSQESEKP